MTPLEKVGVQLNPQIPRFLLPCEWRIPLMLVSLFDDKLDSRHFQHPKSSIQRVFHVNRLCNNVYPVSLCNVAWKELIAGIPVFNEQASDARSSWKNQSARPDPSNTTP